MAPFQMMRGSLGALTPAGDSLKNTKLEAGDGEEGEVGAMLTQPISVSHMKG